MRYQQTLPLPSAAKFDAVLVVNIMSHDAAPSTSVVGEIIDESIAFGAIKSSFVIIPKRPSDRDACGLRIS